MTTNTLEEVTRRFTAWDEAFSAVLRDEYGSAAGDARFDPKRNTRTLALRAVHEQRERARQEWEAAIVAERKSSLFRFHLDGAAKMSLRALNEHAGFAHEEAHERCTGCLCCAAETVLRWRLQGWIPYRDARGAIVKAPFPPAGLPLPDKVTLDGEELALVTDGSDR